MTRSFKGIAVAGLLVSLLAGPASAGTASEWNATKVTLKGAAGDHALRFKGAVIATAQCSADRKIVLFRVTKDGDAVRQKATHSGQWAGYRVKLGNARHGRYFAKATRSAVSDTYGALAVCKADISPTVKI